jgi:hypothetical protein
MNAITCFVRAQTTIMIRFALVQDDRRLLMRTNDSITTPVQSGWVRERSAAQDWLERVVICTVGSVLAIPQGCSSCTTQLSINHIQVEVELIDALGTDPCLVHRWSFCSVTLA